MRRVRLLAAAALLALAAASPSPLRGEDVVIPLRNGRLTAGDLLDFAQQHHGLPLAATLRELRGSLEERPELTVPVELVQVAAALDGSSVRVRYDAATGQPAALVIPKEQVLRRAGDLKGKLYPRLSADSVPRSGIVAVGDTQSGGATGSDSEPDAAAPTGLPMTVLVIAGYRSQHDEAVSFARRLHDRIGLPAAVFYYPTSVPVAANGEALTEAIAGWSTENPDRSLAIVTHSMGGLIARYALEAMPPEQTASVDRLIQVFPPNQGSRLAELTEPRDALDLATAMLRSDADGDRNQEAELEDGVVELPSPRDSSSALDVSLGLLIEGFGGASRDLRPGSELLANLNSRPRRQDVAYTIIAGTDAPLSRWVRLAGGLLDSGPLQRLGRRELGHRFDPAAELLDRYATADELVEGRGDGAVAVASTRLAGVTDHVVLDVNHFAWASEEQSDLIADEVAIRLAEKN